MEIKSKKIVISPFNFFVIATLVVIAISGILSFFNVQTTGIKVLTVNNDIEQYVIPVVSMFSVDGLRYIVSNAIANFVGFAPLGMIIISFIGIGVAQRTEFLRTLFTVISSKFPKKFLTFLVVFISVLCSVYIDAAYVILMPLAAILFMTIGRNPVIGIIASFAGIAGGYGITALVGSLDSSISAYTSIAARLLDPEYGVTIWSNIFIMGFGTILISYVGMIITEKITVPSIGKFRADDDELFIVDKKEIKALRYALLALFIMVIVLIYSLVPNLPGSGFMLDDTTANYVNKLFGIKSPFYQGGTVILSSILLVTGLVYGYKAKTIRKHGNIIKGSIDDIGNVVLLLFAASQFIAIFKQTNIGPFITGVLTNMVSDLNFTGLPLIFLLLFVVIISNLFLTSPILKWSIISPVAVPVFMQANLSPEFAQMIFRIGQATTNGVTPLLAYFVVFVAFVDRYNTNKSRLTTIGTCVKYTIPYSLAFLGVWILLILTFYLIGIPIGLGSYATL